MNLFNLKEVKAVEKISRLTNALSQDGKLRWLFSSLIMAATGLFGVLTTALVWYL